MKSSRLFFKQHKAKLHAAGHLPTPCIITRITTSGVAVNPCASTTIPGLRIGNAVELQVRTDQAQTLTIEARVQDNDSGGAVLGFNNPQDNDVRRLTQWVNEPQNASAPHCQQMLIDELNDITLNHVVALFDTHIKNVKAGLLSMAEAADSNAQQNKLFEALDILNQHGHEITQLSCETLKATAASDTSSLAGASAMTHQDMELIDLTEFEHWLSLESIIRRANEQYQYPLAWLQQRYSQLLKRELSQEQLPVSVDNICHALQHAFAAHDFSPELLPMVYRFFDELVVNQLDELYQTLNDTFKANGILPTIESQPLPKHKTNNTHTNNSDIAQATGHDTTAAPSDTQLVNTVRQFQRLTHEATQDTTTTTGTTVSIAELLTRLNTLQHDSGAINALTHSASLQHTLTTDNSAALSPDIMDLFALVDSIFRALDNYPHISTALLSSIKRLQIPIGKVALLEPSFFSSASHPARQLLNQMIDLSQNSEAPNTSLEQQFEQIITEINNTFEQDTGVFETALKKLSVIAEQQAKTYSRNTQRIVQTYEGKQQLKQAVDSVAHEIYQRVHPPKAPQIIIDLIENGWRELLKLTYLKLGPGSDTWHNNVHVIDQLLNRINNLDSKKKLQPESSVDAFVDAIEQKLNSIFPGDYHYRDTINQLRDILKGLKPITMAEVAPEPHTYDQLALQLKSSRPELSRWFRRAEQASIGDEFTYINDNSGKKNIKLVWISNDKQHFVFVNNRGQKVLDFDLFDLANELSQGLMPVENKSELPLVERSLYSTIQQAYETLAFKSSHDELTGLLNRKECERLLSNAICDAKNNTQHHCLLYIDIDQFSLINDLHGHIAGDQQLTTVSELLQKHLPAQTTTARMAGNEFAILLKSQDAQQHLTIAENLRAVIEKHPFTWQEHDIHLTASIGLVMINQYTNNVVDLVRNGVEACQTAKAHGGNRFYDFCQDSELHTRREKLLGWIDKLDHLLKSDKLVLRAQQISPVAPSQEEPHYEILIALKDDNDQLSSPAEFIEAAESYSRMKKVDRWVIDRAFQWLQSVESALFQTPCISINLSGNSLNDDSLSEFLLTKFEQYSIPTGKICFEVTETATINNIARVADFIRDIKKMGCKFSLDDFGSGNASYQYLRHLPVDYIKIDGLFVQDIDKNTNDVALVKSINEIAHLMGKKTIAEYAESPDIINVLKDIGVDYIQGYANASPMILNEIKLEKQLAPAVTQH